MADVIPTQLPRFPAKRLPGRPPRCVPTREMVLMELWGNRKITVARVKALEILLDELEKGISKPTTQNTIPDWMNDDKAAE